MSSVDYFDAIAVLTAVVAAASRPPNLIARVAFTPLVVDEAAISLFGDSVGTSELGLAGTARAATVTFRRQVDLAAVDRQAMELHRRTTHVLTLDSTQ